MNINDLLNFLPIYAEIEDDNFNNKNYRKKEFYENKLQKNENIPEIIGDLYKHQHFLSKFLSSRTLNDEILLFHEMGTGKTCTSISIIEQIKNEKKSGFDGAIILAKSESLLNNYMNELIFKCTDGKYIPENYEILTELERVHRKKKMTEGWYNLNTFETFAKKIQMLTDNEIIREFSNKIIVIDEIHNIRIQDKQYGEEQLEMYSEFHKFLHLIKNRKIILMSGTPMKDSPDEIASVLNLILPLDKQLPVKEDFLTTYMIKDNNQYRINPDKVEEFRKIIKGRISYLKSMKTSLEINFIGNNLDNQLSHFIVDTDIMSQFQNEHYLNAFKKDHIEKGLYSNSRQASLFVFPNGTYGKEGFQTYIKQKGRNIDMSNKNKRYYNFLLQEELKTQIFDQNEQEMLNKLKQFSCKYESSIRNILDCKNKKLVFVYCDFVKGSGLILFSLILSLFGFEKSNGREKSKKSRYGLISNITSTNKEIRNIVKRFNEPDNLKGEYINVIIGSKIISEGFSLLNVQSEIILTPHWNYSETSQAIFRGIRLGSHKLLLETQDEQPIIDIHQKVSIPLNNIDDSIDFYMYKISENKDISIKSMEKILKENSIDCSFNYLRNNLSQMYNDTRDCEYSDCRYECHDFNLNLQLNNDELDDNTFNLYYDQFLVEEEIKNKIISLFKNNFILDFNKINSKINLEDKYSNISILKSLKYIIDNNLVLINKYGFISYLREENNIYYLVNNLTTESSLELVYYTINPTLKPTINFQELINEPENEILNIINRIQDSQDEETIKMELFSLPNELQLIFIKKSIYGYFLDLDNKNEFLITTILKIYKNFIFNFKFKNTELNNFIEINLENQNIVILITFDNEILYFDIETSKWNVDEDINILLMDNLNEKILQIKNNAFNYYGIFDSLTDAFLISEIKRDKITDIRLKSTGLNCKSYKKRELIQLIKDQEINLDINIDKRDIAEFKQKRPELIQDNTSIEKVIQLVKLYKLHVKDLCLIIKDFMINKNIMIEKKIGNLF